MIQKQHSRIITLLIGVFFAFSFVANAQKAEDKFSRIRIFATDKQIKQIQAKGLIQVIGVNSNPDFVDAEVLQKNIESIKKMGLEVEMIVEDMTTHYTAQANLEKAAKGKKVKKPAAGAPIPTAKKK